MTTIVDERQETAEELEALWELPEYTPAPQRRWTLAAEAQVATAAKLFAKLWVATIAVAWVLEPAPAANVQPPGYWYAASAVFWAMLAGGLLSLRHSQRLALGCFATMGFAGIALGIACRTAGHHGGSFWLVETLVFGVLGAAAAAQLVRRS